MWNKAQEMKRGAQSQKSDALVCSQRTVLSFDGHILIVFFYKIVFKLPNFPYSGSDLIGAHPVSMGTLSGRGGSFVAHL